VLGDGAAARDAVRRALATLTRRDARGDDAEADLLFHRGLFLLLAGEGEEGRAAVADALARNPGPRLAADAAWRLRVLEAADPPAHDLRPPADAGLVGLGKRHPPASAGN